MLTKRQREAFDFISDQLMVLGTAPTFREIRDHLGLRSQSGIHRVIEGLVERGYIRRIPKRARAIEIIKRPPPRYGSIDLDDGLARLVEAYADLNRTTPAAVIREAVAQYLGADEALPDFPTPEHLGGPVP